MTKTKKAFPLYYLLRDKHQALTVPSLSKHASTNASWTPSGRHCWYQSTE